MHAQNLSFSGFPPAPARVVSVMWSAAPPRRPD